MRIAVFFALSVLVFAQDATAPDTTPDERAAILQAQRDTLAIIAQANQAVQSAQKREADAIAKVEQRVGCRLDRQTVRCQKPEVKK